MPSIKQIKKAKDVLSIRAILNSAFTDSRDISRVYSKILRGSPELTPDESQRIEKSLESHGIRFNGE